MVNTLIVPAASEMMFDEYMEQYAADFYELEDGILVKMSPVADTHDIITRLMSQLLSVYLELRPIGILREEPFVLKLSEKSAREPDLMVVLNEHLDRVEKNRVMGKADLVIEVVSLESSDRDYGKKFTEYEMAGIPEYWMIDPLRRETRFWRLADTGLYASQPTADFYETPLLPGPIAIGEVVKGWLGL